jgi:hypothetical protein
LLVVPVHLIVERNAVPFVLLPSPEETALKSAQADVPALSLELVILLQLKARILSELENYSAFDGMTSEQRRVAIKLLASGM